MLLLGIIKWRFLLPVFLALTVTTAGAQQTLFEVTFGQLLARSEDSRSDFHVGKETRRNGPLAPVDYTHNGEGWQGQTHFNPMDGVVCCFLTRQPWLLATPAWELQSDDGNYEITFEFGFPAEGTTPVGVRDEQPRTPVPPAETLLAIGPEMPAAADSKPPNQGITLIITAAPASPWCSWSAGERPGNLLRTPETMRVIPRHSAGSKRAES